MLTTVFFICIAIQLLMTYYFALLQVRLDSHFLWIERGAILSAMSNLLIVYTLAKGNIASDLVGVDLIFLWGAGSAFPIFVMYLIYSYWINHKLLVRNGYIRIFK